MIISYPYNEECPAQPLFCRCKDYRLAHFQRRGSYFRIVAEVICYCFHCTTCQTHITMVPSSCVPYKHIPADDVESCLCEALKGRSPVEIEGDSSINKWGMHRSTIRRHLAEWFVNSAMLASVSSEKFSMFLSGSPQTIFQKLSNMYHGSCFFRRIQPYLCQDYPPMGLLQSLIFLS